MANSIGMSPLASAQGRPTLQMGALGMDVLSAAVIVLSALLLLTSFLRRVLEAAPSGGLLHKKRRSAFGFLRCQMEGTDGSCAETRPKASRRRNRKRHSLATPVPCSLPQPPPLSTAQLDDDVGKVDVEANAGLITDVPDIASDDESGSMACSGIPQASGPEASQPSAVGDEIAEEMAKHVEEDVDALELVEADSLAGFLLEGQAESGMVQGQLTPGASCGCVDDGVWGCECHTVYGKGLLLAHLAIHRRVALGAPGLDRQHQAPSQIILPSTRALPKASAPQMRSTRLRDAGAHDMHPRCGTAPRCSRPDRC